jgi:hypothetical protein
MALFEANSARPVGLLLTLDTAGKFSAPIKLAS